MPTTVVNRRRTQAYDVYIGRPSKWGNPFRIGRDGDRVAVICKFAEWFYAPEQHQLRLDAVAELKDKVLGCWCAPFACHGGVIATFVDTYDAAQRTWNTCPDCGVRWPDAVPTPGLLHRTRLCGPCASIVGA